MIAEIGKKKKIVSEISDLIKELKKIRMALLEIIHRYCDKVSYDTITNICNLILSLTRIINTSNREINELIEEMNRLKEKNKNLNKKNE